jgi:hypothetical protein
MATVLEFRHRAISVEKFAAAAPMAGAAIASTAVGATYAAPNAPIGLARVAAPSARIIAFSSLGRRRP